MAADQDPLASLRVAIDAIDDQLLELLNRRARLAQEVAERKQGMGGSFYVPARERAIIDRLQEQNEGPFPTAAIRPVFQEVISACLSLEEGVRVSYLGPEGTFTHQAVKRHFGTSARTVPCGSIPAVFEEVERGVVDFGVVPVENSSEGIVSHTLDSFLDSELRICAEIGVDVDHCLLAHEGVSEAGIQRVYSHPQALSQCRRWIARNLPQAALVETSSTSEAARAATSDAAGAAVAAELASKLYGLVVLRRQLQDMPHNVTRFLVIGKGEQPAPSRGGGDRTSVLLVLPAEQPGALYEVPKPLSDTGVNLTKIESRPSRRKPWEYVFFLDLDGHQHDAAVQRALARMSEVCDLFKILGSYRKADWA
jgi:chorismate mutase / prephenate dehydratase